MRKTGYLISIVLFSVLFLIPLLCVISRANITDVISIFKNKYYQHIIGFTLKQALLSSLISVIVGLPGAWIISHYDFKFKKTVKLIYYIPFVLPSILVVLGFVIFYGNTGFFNKFFGTNIKILYRFSGVLIAHVFYNFPVVISIVSNKWEKTCIETEEQARTDGASEFVIFTRITLPSLINSIISSALLVFLFCFTSFAIILVLGGGPKLSTVEVEIYQLARISFNVNKACSLALISLSFAVLIIFSYNCFSKSEPETLTYSKRHKAHPTTAGYSIRIFTGAYLIISSLFIVLPVISIVFRAFVSSDSRAGISFISANAFENTNIKAIINTIIIGLGSAVLSVLISFFICSHKTKNKFKEVIFLLPLACSSIIIGLGYFIMAEYSLNIPEIPTLILCHGVLNVPYAYKSISPVYSALPKELIEESKSIGADDNTILTKIELPYIKNTLISTLSFCFALSCGEMNSSIMVVNGTFTTIPLQIQRMISSYNYQGACAMGVVLLIICTAVFVSGEKIKDH